MRLVFDFDPSEQFDALLRAVENRLYVARLMVPEGYEATFRDRARATNAQTSTAIEGNPLSSQRALQVLVNGPDESHPYEVEIANVEAAYQFVALIATDATLRIDEGVIRSLNFQVLRGLPGAARNRGKYRAVGAQIVDADTRGIRYTAPPPTWLPELMAGFVDDLNRWLKEGHPLVAAAKAHFGLVSIHPFQDGNGRTARLLADLVLEATSQSADSMISVSSVLARDRDGYYDALRQAQGPHFSESVDITRFAEFHTNALLRAAFVLEERAVQFQKTRDTLVASSDGRLHVREVTALMFLGDLGAVSTSEYARLNGVSPSTAALELRRMVDSGVLSRVGSGKNTRYVVSDEFSSVVAPEEPEQLSLARKTSSSDAEPPQPSAVLRDRRGCPPARDLLVQVHGAFNEALAEAHQRRADVELGGR